MTLPVSEGACILDTVTNTSSTETYYESFPTKLFDEKHNHILGLFVFLYFFIYYGFVFNSYIICLFIFIFV